MKIKIKRATIYGLKDAEGELIKLKGYQFCLVKDSGIYFIIELTTGCSVRTINALDKKDALVLAKAAINSRTKEEFYFAINNVKNVFCRKYKFNIPVNEPIY